jgi:hypothetical protein
MANFFFLTIASIQKQDLYTILTETYCTINTIALEANVFWQLHDLQSMMCYLTYSVAYGCSYLTL